jgi:hypothetical protein
MIEVVQAIISVQIQLLIGIILMNDFVHLALQESVAQCGADKHDQC